MVEISITTRCLIAVIVLICSDLFIGLVTLGYFTQATYLQILAAKIALIISVAYITYLILRINTPLCHGKID